MVKKNPLADGDTRGFCSCIAQQLVAAPLTPAERDGLVNNFGERDLDLAKTKQGLMARVMNPCVR